MMTKLKNYINNYIHQKIVEPLTNEIKTTLAKEHQHQLVLILDKINGIQAKAQITNKPQDNTRPIYTKIACNSTTPTQFLVFSTGCSATTWLSATLQKNPHIVCTAGVTELNLGFDLTNERYENLSIDAFLEEHEQFFPLFNFWPSVSLKKSTEILACGNVHAYRIASFQRMVNKFGLNKPIQTANLIRHPIPRTQTHYKIWLHSYQAGYGSGIKEVSSVLELQRDKYEHLAQAALNKSYNALSDEERIFFFSTFDTIETNIEDFIVDPTIFTIKIELLKSDRDYFQNVLRYLVGNKIPITPEYLDEVFSDENMKQQRALNSNSGIQVSPVEIFDSWEDWQKLAFKIVADKLNMCGYYQAHGYQFPPYLLC